MEARRAGTGTVSRRRDPGASGAVADQCPVSLHSDTRPDDAGCTVRRNRKGAELGGNRPRRGLPVERHIHAESVREL